MIYHLYLGIANKYSREFQVIESSRLYFQFIRQEPTVLTSETIIDINENLKLIQNINGLTFGTDAYLLAAFTETGTYNRTVSDKIAVDLGSGSGIIPLLCASKKRFSQIYAVEIQSNFGSIIKRNAEINGFDEIIRPIITDVRDVKPSIFSKAVDVVTANPPYMTQNSGKRNEHDEKYIARHEVYGTIDDFCACACRILKFGGKFLTVWRPDRLGDLMYSLRKNKMEVKCQIFVYAHPACEPSMVLTEAIKGASPGMKVLRPLFLSDSKENSIKNILSCDAKKIYEDCSFKNFN